MATKQRDIRQKDIDQKGIRQKGTRQRDIRQRDMGIKLTSIMANPMMEVMANLMMVMGNQVTQPIGGKLLY